MNEQEEKAILQKADNITRILEQKLSRLERRNTDRFVQGMTPEQRKRAMRITGAAIMELAATGESFKIHVVQDPETGNIQDAEWTHD